MRRRYEVRWARALELLALAASLAALVVWMRLL